MELVRGGRQLKERSSHQLFDGDASLQSLIDQGGLRVNDVEFRAGGRTKWHTHTFEQVLIITEGAGIVATDESEQLVSSGDIVMINAGERHWHGAQPDCSMKHVSINGPGETQW